MLNNKDEKERKQFYYLSTKVFLFISFFFIYLFQSDNLTEFFILLMIFNSDRLISILYTLCSSIHAKYKCKDKIVAKGRGMMRIGQEYSCVILYI